MRLALVTAALVLAVAPAAHAEGWSAPVRLSGTSEPIPRTAIARDGTSLTVWTRADFALMAAAGERHGRFAAPIRVAKRPFGYAVAVAPHGQSAIAYEARDGVHVALRSGRGFRDRLVAAGTGSEINGVTIAADPLGGWVVAEREFPRHGSGTPYHVRVLSLDERGLRIGDVQELGEGEFGIDARVAKALGVFANGRAVLVFEAAGGRGVLVSTRPHHGAFSAPAPIGTDLTDPALSVSGNHAYVGAVDGSSCGDAGCSGAPMMSVIGPDGVPGAPSGPQLANPRRALAASAGPGALVFSLKDAPSPFSREAGVSWAAPAGDAHALTHDLATEPVALVLHPGTLVLWTTRTRFGAARIFNGRAHRIAAPPGLPPSPFHTNSTNRDYASAGWYVIAAWARAGVVRVSVRRF